MRRAQWIAVLALTFGMAGGSMAEPSKWMRYPAISPDGSTIAFSYRGDLWLVSASGGKATPLTLHEAFDTRPIWSHDGSKIAFASDRYGNFDVWVIPSEGGEAMRLTYHSAQDHPTAFTSDDGAVLFVSSRLDSAACVQYPTGAQPELYSVSLSQAACRRKCSAHPRCTPSTIAPASAWPIPTRRATKTNGESTTTRPSRAMSGS